MKAIDLFDLTQKYELFSTSLSLFEKYLEYETNHKRSQVDYTEINVLTTCVKTIIDVIGDDVDETIFKGFFYGFTIPQINAEFDLLKITENSVVMIELKSEFEEEKARKQLKRQKYYLKYLTAGKYFKQYLFNKQDMNFYCLSSDELTLENCELSVVYREMLNSRNSVVDDHLETLFDPAQFLVSPFNETEKFLNDEYFLTEQQEREKEKVLKQIEEEDFSVITITGGPGTGKSLLVYDIYKTLRNQGRQAAVIHCGHLNSGHEKLIKNNYLIKPIKTFRLCLNNEIDVLFIDEAQRINPFQFSQIMEFASVNKVFVILSYDKEQFLKSEENGRITENLKKYSVITQIKLKGKIRTNPILNEFTQLLFWKNRKKNDEINFSENIYTYYAQTYDEALNKIKEINLGNTWKEIYYSPSLKSPNTMSAAYYFDYYRSNKSSNSFQVLGQEYDNVITFIDIHFFYDESGSLLSRKSDYPGLMYNKSLFQNITRARKKLYIIVINNPDVYERILEILN